MKELQKEFKKRISLLNIGKEVELQNIFNELIGKCISFYTQRNAALIIDKDNIIIDVNPIFLNWFNLDRKSIIGKNFIDIFYSSYKDILEGIIKNIDAYKYNQYSGIYLNINDKKYFLEISGEEITIQNSKYKLILFKDKEFDLINYKLSMIERKIDNILFRIKDIKVLMNELSKIFIDSLLFNYIWIGKIDIKTQFIVPTIEMGDTNQIESIEQSDFDRDKLVKDLLKKKDLIIYKVNEDISIIAFPLSIECNIQEDDVLNYAILTSLKEDIHFKEADIFRLKDIVNKIKITTTEIFLKECVAENILKDPLTGLPLRKVFLEKVKALINDKIPFSLAILDIDNLSKVNDVLGFWAGDKALMKLSEHIVKIDVDYIARIGGDEFGIIIKGDKNRLYKALDDILKFNDIFTEIDGMEIFTPISIAVSSYPEDARDVDSLVLVAEKVLNEGKKKGGQRVEFSNKKLSYLPKDYLEIEKELIEALKKNQFVLHYQPIIDVQKKKIYGVEALIRWMSPKRGLVPPYKFIPILEETNLINKVGDWIIYEVCNITKRFKDMELMVLFSMNISIKQMFNKNIAREIISSANKLEVDKKLLIVEITESILMENIEELKSQINELSKSGIRIEIDDFGTGYSSLAYLKELPVYGIKIDRTFIKDIENKESFSLVNAIISMAKALGKKTIAEGVETENQLKILEDLGVDMVQGYYFAKPMPEEDLKVFIRDFPKKAL